MKLSDFPLKNISYDNRGLVPAIVQDVMTKSVLMMAYMNEASLQKTIETGETWFFSRSRQEFWHKGATSGNIQRVVDITIDCDNDTLLLLVEQTGEGACHTGAYSCFYTPVAEDIERKAKHPDPLLLQKLYDIIVNRKAEMSESSYTASLFRKGTDSIVKKFGEEAFEVALAAKGAALGEKREQLIYELADLLYHLSVLRVESEVVYDDIYKELEKRFHCGGFAWKTAQNETEKK